jgi:ketosteroid isomerase-like protein
MSAETLALIRDGYDAMNRGDMDAVAEQLHPDVEWKVPDILPDTLDRSYRGAEGVKRFLETWFEVFPDFRVEIEEMMDFGEHVLVMATAGGQGRGSGAEVVSPSFPHVWSFRDGKVIRMEMFPRKAEALRALGLSGEPDR